MRAWWVPVGHHLSRRHASTLALVLGGAAGAALAPAGSGASGAALVAATALLSLVHLAGSVGGEIRSGRAVLGAGAAGSAGRWLARESFARLAALAVALAALWLLAALLLLPRAGAAAALLETVPFLALLALVVGAVAWASSAIADRLDGLLATVYLVPATLFVLGVTTLRGTPSHPLALLVAPVEALLAFAPAYGGGPARAEALGHIAAFVAAWTTVGFLWARARIAISGIWPRG